MDVTSSVNTASHRYGGSSVCLGDKRHHSGWCSVEEMKDGRPWALTWCDDVLWRDPSISGWETSSGVILSLCYRNREGGSCVLSCAGKGCPEAAVPVAWFAALKLSSSLPWGCCYLKSRQRIP